MSLVLGSAAMSRMRPPMLLGPSAPQTWSVLGDPMAATPIALDCAIASLTAASGMEPSALARCRYIHSSAPTGSSVAADWFSVRSHSDPVTETALAPKMTVRAAAATIGTCVLLRIAVPPAASNVHRAADSKYLRKCRSSVLRQLRAYGVCLV